MGVSRKLGPPGRGENSVSEVGFQWSSQRYSLEELSARFRLPVVVQCVAETCQVLTSTFTFDLSQPLVLFSSRCRRKVKARCLVQPRGSTTPKEVGPPLIIPEDYDGWFAVGGDGGRLACYGRVGEVADAAISRVVVAKRQLVLVQSASALGATYTERHLDPGEVLTVLGTCKGELALPSGSPFKRSRRFLRCLDERGDNLLLCVSQRCVLYQVAPRATRENTVAVVCIKQLLAARDLMPLHVRHVMGEPPSVLRHAFSGLLRLDSVFSERSLLATPLAPRPSRPRPLELALRSRLCFRLALNHSQLLRTREGMRALDVCETRGGAYLSALKVAFTLRPEVSPLEDLDLTLYEARLPRGKSPRPTARSACNGTDSRVEEPQAKTSALCQAPPGCGLEGQGEGGVGRGGLEGEGGSWQGAVTRRAREYHGEPLSDSQSDSQSSSEASSDGEEEDEDEQASAEGEVDALSEFEIDWEPERHLPLQRCASLGQIPPPAGDLDEDEAGDSWPLATASSERMSSASGLEQGEVWEKTPHRTRAACLDWREEAGGSDSDLEQEEVRPEAAETEEMEARPRQRGTQENVREERVSLALSDIPPLPCPRPCPQPVDAELTASLDPESPPPLPPRAPLTPKRTSRLSQRLQLEDEFTAPVEV